MLVIKSIDFYEVNGDVYEMVAQSYREGGMRSLMTVGSPAGDTSVPVSVVAELIKGRRFVGPGVDMVIGVSEQAQKVIGIQYEAWENADKLIADQSYTIARKDRELNECGESLSKAHNELDAIKGASLFQRIKWVFTGYTSPPGHNEDG